MVTGSAGFGWKVVACSGLPFLRCKVVCFYKDGLDVYVNYLSCENVLFYLEIYDGIYFICNFEVCLISLFRFESLEGLFYFLTS
jgi:hypothetical protein